MNSDDPDALTVRVTAQDIAAGDRADFNTHPLLVAVARALGRAAGFDVAEDEDGGVALELPGGSLVTLPRRVWGYGPSGGADIPQFAVRNPQGAVLALHSYAEIVRPFEFRLEAV